MIPTQIYIEAFKRKVPFQIKFKSASQSQQLIAFLIRWYLPTYLTHYTTVIGRSIYLPNEDLLKHPTTRFTIAHEVVHLLDQQRLSTPIFLLLYLSPQILVLGVLSFPWLEYNALWFLLFGLPWPSPGRVFIEARAYGLELLLYKNAGYQIDYNRFVDLFVSPSYYFMSWTRSYGKRQLLKFYQLASRKGDPTFDQVIEIFNSCAENSAND